MNLPLPSPAVLRLAAAVTCSHAGAAGSTAIQIEALLPPPPAATIPKGKRVPATWTAVPIGREPVTLKIEAPKATAPAGRAWLRVTTALDSRERRHILASVAQGGRELGRMDLRFAHALEIFQLELTPEQAAEVRGRGVSLRLEEEGEPLWLLATGSRESALPREFGPHLMTAVGEAVPVSEFRLRLASLASLQPFGWMEGCVLEGLRDLAVCPPGGEDYTRALDAHWRQFVPAPGRLVYEDPRSQPGDQRIHSIEDGLPFADLARRDAGSSGVELFVGYTARLRRSDGAIQGGAMLSAEGSYTIAYPLAVIGEVRNRAAFAAMAREQLRVRRDRLWHEGALWLRHYDDGRRTFRGWARGVAWHALGVSRSIAPMRKHGSTGEEDDELRRIAAWIMPLQRPDGLWSCFVEDRATAPDTSGSAGIAAALAHGAKLGILPADAHVAARRALAALRVRLTPDGFLQGAAQSNRGGEELQRTDYRVISQMGMGLLAQLMAACGEPPP